MCIPSCETNNNASGVLCPRFVRYLLQMPNYASRKNKMIVKYSQKGLTRLVGTTL